MLGNLAGYFSSNLPSQTRFLQSQNLKIHCLTEQVQYHLDKWLVGQKFYLILILFLFSHNCGGRIRLLIFFRLSGYLLFSFLYQKAWLHKHKKWSRSVLQMIYWANCLLKSIWYFLETDETLTTVKWKNQEFVTATTIYFIEAKIENNNQKHIIWWS